MPVLYRRFIAAVLLLALAAASVQALAQLGVGDYSLTGAPGDMGGLVVSPDSLNLTANVFAPESLGPDSGPTGKLSITVYGVLYIDVDRDASTGIMAPGSPAAMDLPLTPAHAWSPAVPGVDVEVWSYYSLYYWNVTGASYSLDAGVEYVVYAVVNGSQSWDRGVVENASMGDGWVGFTIPWQKILDTYESLTSERPRAPFRVFLPIVPYPGYDLAAPYFSWESEVDVRDYVTGQPVSTVIPEATVEVDGLIGDWPGDAATYQEPAEDFGAYSFIDALSVMAAADSSSLYLALPLAGEANLTLLCSGSGGDLTTGRVLAWLGLDQDGDGDNDGSINMDLCSSTATIYNTLQYKYVYNVPLQVAASEAVEIAIPQESLQDAGINLTAGANLTLYPTYQAAISYQRSDTLNTPDYGLAWTITLIVDPEEGTLTQLPPVNGSTTSTPPGAQAIVTAPGITVQAGNASSWVTLAAAWLPYLPVDAPTPPGLTPIANYYYSISNTSAVQWPVNVTVSYPDEDIDEATVQPYYYDKEAGAWKPIPPSLYQVDYQDNTITIHWTLQLYQAGDPGITILAAPPSVSGTLQDSPTKQDAAAPLLALATALLAAAALAARRRR